MGLPSQELTCAWLRINGVIVIVKDEDHNGQMGRQLWLDDTTATVCVLLSPRVSRRLGSKDLKVGKLVTVFGSVVSKEDGKLAVLCGGFHIEDDPLIEAHHWLMVMQANPIPMMPITATPSPTSEITRTPIDEQDTVPVRQQPVFQGQHQSLLSQPSPNRGPTHHLHIPSSSSTDEFFHTNIDEEDEQWNWSPDHAFASSTPLSRVQQQSILASSAPGRSIRASPLRSEMYKSTEVMVVQQASSFEFEDSFDAEELEDLERKALALVENKPIKRPFDQVD